MTVSRPPHATPLPSSQREALRGHALIAGRCERCWREAGLIAVHAADTTQAAEYQRLVREAHGADEPRAEPKATNPGSSRCEANDGAGTSPVASRTADTEQRAPSPLDAGASPAPGPLTTAPSKSDDVAASAPDGNGPIPQSAASGAGDLHMLSLIHI